MNADARSGEDVAALFDLEGKHFIVLGAGQGIGAACARGLHSLGATVMSVDRDASLAESIAAELGGPWLAADATSEAGIGEVIAAAKDALGRIDGAVDVIGRGSRVAIEDLDTAAWQAEFDVNLGHAYLLGRHLAPVLAEQGDGVLIFISSVVSEYGTHVTPAYHAAKAALVSWMRSLAVTYGPRGVRANAVSPGGVLTERMKGHWEASGASLDEVLKPTALKRLAEPSDVAAAVAFLASPAARMITGQAIVVDAGTTVRDPFYGDSEDETLV